MIQPDDQTIRDLGFDLIREWLKGYSVQPTARERFSSLALHSSTQALRSSMELLSEWLMIRRSGAAFPAIDFEELTAEIAMLEVKDGVLSEVSFERIWRASALVNELVKALTEIEEGFPRLRELMKEVHYTEELITAITGVFDAKWNVKDSASPELAAIRLQIGDVRRQISKNFQKAMKDYASKGFLGDTGEAFINERRVLAVYSTHKRKISGIVVGSSNTGALTYIEPEVNIQLNFELEALHDDERNEVRKILRKLTRDIRTQAPLIDAYQTLLTELDFLQAKTRLAMELDASIPLISEEQVIRMKKAYHPILWMNNRKAGRVTFPQDIAMDKFSRMLIISGPNAGGKSITLKTIGLL
ncbi:MAG: DNA mismatch repair protein MutS, partial [Flavobacteriales bacterium]